MACNTNYVSFTPIAEFILNYEPQLYNPLYSTFNSRVTHVDGAYEITSPVIYVGNDGYVRKILASEKDKKQLLEGYMSCSGYDEWLSNEINKLENKMHYISIPGKYKVMKAIEYQLNSDINFNTEGYNAEKYIVKGIGNAESWGSWTDGDEAELTLKTQLSIKQLF